MGTKFYFDVREGGETIIDEEGVILPAVDTALTMAKVAVTEMARDVLSTGQIDQLTVVVRTAEKIIAHATVYLRVDFPEA